MPEYQGRGIGTAILRDFVATAHRAGLPASLHVLRVNEAAQRLYRRLGFRVVSEVDVGYIMQLPLT
jgi:ribosomal protein S18 acetylase RimI-like enzyme